MNKFVNNKKNSKATSEKKRSCNLTGPNAYRLFTADAHSKVRAENPGLQFSEISRLVN